MKARINIITMGCSKNLVDSEHLAARAAAAGYEVVFDSDDPGASVVVVNTCGFIGDAKEESVNMILECAVFAAIVAGLNLYVFQDSMIGWNPSPLWIMVLIVAMRHGSPAGLIGGCLAAVLHLWELTRAGHGLEELLHRSPEMLIVPVLYIFISRTRRAINCVNCDPQSMIAILSK